MMMPRQSSFPQPQAMQFDQFHQQQHMHQPSPHLISSLQQCVSSTANCVETMKESIEAFEFVLQDHPRLITVLKCQKHFDLVSERDIDSARSHISGEVLPHLNELLQRASVEMERQERRAVALKNKAEAQHQRLQAIKSIDQHQAKLHPSSKTSRSQAHQQTLAQLQQQLESQRAQLSALKMHKLELLKKADDLEAATRDL
ncbi:hypothetical protein BCV70DRAFT_200486 [Testicularia cyperi]|uniref:DASH complex subunit SPC19 n=1 Tax=Testicularia cyperi TaxID=1882483 RepID=A0A317XPV2_9BASI|nr:hypothetical protein BCV70DRAFT_200486 [Testicularia cyperi]